MPCIDCKYWRNGDHEAAYVAPRHPGFGTCTVPGDADLPDHVDHVLITSGPYGEGGGDLLTHKDHYCSEYEEQR